MDNKPDLKGQIVHNLQNNDACGQTSSRADSVPHELGHSFAVNSNIAGELINGEVRLFNAPNNLIAEDEDDEEPGEEEDEGESSQADKSFSSVDYLEIMHGEILDPETNNGSDPDVPDEDSDLTCKNPHCSFTTTDMEAYLKHEYEHVDGKSYQCDVCNMKFNVFSSMRSHRMLHLSHRPYKCRLCSKEFARKDLLLEHLVRQHSKQKPYRCPFCPKHFKLRLQLKMHLSNEHSAATLIKTCKLCGFKAASPHAFRSHLMICYLKRSFNAPDASECNQSPISLVSSETNAMDFGAVSRNFSFVPSHYVQPYTLVSGDNTHPMPGPSDMTQVVSLHTTTPAVCTLSGKKQDLDPCTGEANICRVSSLASSTTTTVSPTATHINNDESPQNLVVGSAGPFVKSEPSEMHGENSQNGSALPTSTMDLSTANIVETSFNCNEAACCQTTPDLPVKIRVSSYHDKSRSQSCSLPTEGRRCENDNESGSCSARSKMCYATMKIKCSSASNDAASVKSTVCRCHSSETRLQEKHCATSSKRERHSDSHSGDSDQQHGMSHISNKRSCKDKGTITESFIDTSHQNTACHRSRCSHNDGFIRSGAPSTMESCTDSKSQIALKDMEVDSYTCPFCEITFPDQTLYFLHRSLHSETHPWKCNLCGKVFRDKYDFNSHIISQGHH